MDHTQRVEVALPIDRLIQDQQLMQSLQDVALLIASQPAEDDQRAAPVLTAAGRPVDQFNE